MSIQATTPEQAEVYYKALSEGGAVTMPLQETFWAKRFGMCTDRFGIPWMVNCQKAEMSPPAKKRYMTLWRPAGKNAMPDPKVIENIVALVNEMQARGAMVMNGGWDPNGPCTTVKTAAGKVSVTDGPFAEAKEVISGFCMMQTASKEEAVEWARRFMAIAGDGTTEMREIGGSTAPGPDCGK